MYLDLILILVLNLILIAFEVKENSDSAFILEPIGINKYQEA